MDPAGVVPAGAEQRRPAAGRARQQDPRGGTIVQNREVERHVEVVCGDRRVPDMELDRRSTGDASRRQERARTSVDGGDGANQEIAPALLGLGRIDGDADQRRSSQRGPVLGGEIGEQIIDRDGAIFLKNI